MEEKIKKMKVYSPVTRYVTTDGAKFDNSLEAEKYQYNLERRVDRKYCFKLYGIYTNMYTLVSTDEMAEEKVPSLFEYFVPGHISNYDDFVALRVNTLDEMNEIFAAFKDEMSEKEKDSLQESFMINGKFPCVIVFFRDHFSTKFDWICLENEIEKMRKTVIDAKNELSLNI